MPTKFKFYLIVIQSYSVSLEGETMTMIWIAIFGVAGVFSRYGMSIMLAGIFDQTLPVATFCINILGSFLIGAAYALGIERAVMTESVRLGIMVGFLGGFTTFSSFSLETVRLIEMNRTLQAMIYVLASTLLGIMATFAGLLLCRK